MRIGYTLMTEQAGPREIVRHAAAAEAVGFPFAVSSDHYFPWLDSQGHAGHAWTMLGAVSQVTERIELMTYVTCPTFRYHPAVVAQKAATLQLLSDNRFTLGLGSGENLNEHVATEAWPGVNTRHRMLSEAVDIIGALFDGGYVSYDGEYFQVDSAKVWDLPEVRVPIGVAVSGKQSVETFADRAQVMIATEPKPELGKMWDEARGTTGRKVGQLPICWDADEKAAIERAHDQFRWFAGGWKVNAELPGTAGFDAASQFARPEDVAEQIPCGDKVEKVVEALQAFADAGFTDVALVQIGGDHQDPFFEAAKAQILPALAEAFPG